MSTETIPFIYLCLKEVLWDSLLQKGLGKSDSPIKFFSLSLPRREVIIHCKNGDKPSFRSLMRVELNIFEDPELPKTPSKKICCSLSPKTEADGSDLAVVFDLRKEGNKSIHFDTINSDNLNDPEEVSKVAYLQELVQAVIDISDGKLEREA
jgi:hypothetical protein